MKLFICFTLCPSHGHDLPSISRTPPQNPKCLKRFEFISHPLCSCCFVWVQHSFLEFITFNLLVFINRPPILVLTAASPMLSALISSFSSSVVTLKYWTLAAKTNASIVSLSLWGCWIIWPDSITIAIWATVSSVMHSSSLVDSHWLAHQTHIICCVSLSFVLKLVFLYHQCLCLQFWLDCIGFEYCKWW